MNCSTQSKSALPTFKRQRSCADNSPAQINAGVDVLETERGFDQRFGSKRTYFGRLLLLVLLLPTITMGCIADPYQYGVADSKPLIDFISPDGVQPIITVDGDYPKLDKLENAISTPARFFRGLGGKKELDQEVIDSSRKEGLDLAQEFLEANSIDDLYIDVRRYEPKQQWARIKANQRIRPIWKYTGGTLSWIRYTLLPLRPLKIDQYNPYTNTLNLNSANPAQALFESAEAKEFRKHKDVGTYAMIQFLPFVPIMHDARSGSDVLSYVHDREMYDLQDELYPLSYARVGSTTAAEILSFSGLDTPFYVSPLVRVTGATIGRLAGRIVAQSKRKKQKKTGASAGDNWAIDSDDQWNQE